MCQAAPKGCPAQAAGACSRRRRDRVAVIRNGRADSAPAFFISAAAIERLPELLKQRAASVTAERSYIRDGAAIYERSFATIRAEADLSAFSGMAEKVAMRIIHACGMVEIVRDIVMSADFADKGRAALLAGAPILCDAKMVAQGITRSRLPANNAVICTLDDPGVPEAGARDGQYALGGGAWSIGARISGGSVVAIGNAPTSLVPRCEIWMRARLRRRPSSAFRWVSSARRDRRRRWLPMAACRSSSSRAARAGAPWRLRRQRARERKNDALEQFSLDQLAGGAAQLRRQSGVRFIGLRGRVIRSGGRDH